MYSKEIKIVNPSGIHARPASQVCSKASQYESSIKFKRKGDEDFCDAKSIVHLLMFGFMQGEEVIIIAEGHDEEKAVEELAELIAMLDE